MSTYLHRVFLSGALHIYLSRQLSRPWAFAAADGRHAGEILAPALGRIGRATRRRFDHAVVAAGAVQCVRSLHQISIRSSSGANKLLLR